MSYVLLLFFLTLHALCGLVYWVGVSPVAVWVCVFTFGIRMFGISAGYHRYFSHRTFKTSRWFQFCLACLGCSALQKDPMWWAAMHRNHHRYAETEADPHSPSTRGLFWAHMGWVLVRKNLHIRPDPLVPDWVKYPELRFLRWGHHLPALALGLGLAGIGAVLDRVAPNLGTSALQLFTWGFVVSTVLLYHATYSVNSLAHRFGTRRFETRDQSRNNFWIALWTLGEGWHNNHHRFPASVRQGLYWWELDISYGILKVLSWCGVVWALKVPPPHRVGLPRPDRVVVR